MPAPFNAFQAGIYSRLTGYAPLTAVIGSNKVFDFVPQKTTPPYIMIGDDAVSYDDTKSNNGWELTFTLHCWDYEVAGRKSVKTIMSHIYDALHNQQAAITVTGFQLVMIQFDSAETFQEAANEGASDHYYHGVMRFRAVVRN
jgi:hypothetical protein